MSKYSPITILARKMKNVDSTYDKLESLILERLHSQLYELCHMWNDVGVYEAAMDDRCATVARTLSELVEQMVAEERGLVEKLKRNTEHMVASAINLSRELDIPFEQPIENATTFEIQRAMKELIKKLNDKKNSQIKRWYDLLSQMEEDNKLMKKQTQKIRLKTEVPTMNDIGLLKLHADDTREELEVRKKQIQDCKRKIKMMVSELDYEMEYEEKLYASDNLGDLLYSSTNLEKHNEFILKLEKIKKFNLGKISSYKEELKRPFEFKLDGEEAYNEEEFNHFCMASNNLLMTLKDKVRSKRHKIKLAVQKKQTELLNLWDLCQVTSKHKDDKNALLNDMPHVDCILLKEEISIMEKYYNDHKDIFDMHKSYREMFFDLLEAEKRCIDASRRLNNMSSTQEDKPRNKLLKQILQLQSKLASKVSELEAKEGRNLLFRGMTLSDYFEQINDHLKASKEAWKTDGGTPSGTRHNCCMRNHNLKTPRDLLSKDEPLKNFRKSESKLSNRKEPGQQQIKYSKDGQNSNFCGVEARPPRSATILRSATRSGHLHSAAVRRTKTCRPTSTPVKDSKLEISEIENADPNIQDVYSNLEEFYLNQSHTGKTFVSSSVLENLCSTGSNGERKLLVSRR